MKKDYVIITPAYNEARYIAMTIGSVIAQTVRPLLWVIVDDGSTDETAEIIKSYAKKYKWIRYIYRRKTPGQTYFGSNVQAIMEGYAQIKDLSFDYLSVLDADISLPQDYYRIILARFAEDSRLGVASGVYENLIDGKLHKVLNDRRSTPKAIMVFRRDVFEQIGGFLPLKYGGEDTAACIMARMRGWKTWSFADIKAVHHRPTGLGSASSILKARFGQGKSEYDLGNHPLFVLLKSIRRCAREKPFIVGGLARFAGYLSQCARRPPRQVSADVIRFYRKEQLRRIFRANVIPLEMRVNVQ